MTAEFRNEDGEDLIDRLVSLEYDGKWRDEKNGRGEFRESRAGCGPFWLRAEWNKARDVYWASINDGHGEDPMDVVHPAQFASLDEAKRGCVAMLRECVTRMAKIVDDLERA